MAFRVELASVGSGGTLTEEEGVPVVGEGTEPHGEVEGLFFDLGKAGAGPECGEFAGAAEGHVALVFRVSAGIEGDGGIPEEAEHAHLAAIVPDGGSDGAAGLGDADELAESSGGVGDEVEDEEGEAGVEGRRSEAKLLGVAGFEVDAARVGRAAGGEGDVFLGRVDAESAALGLAGGEGEGEFSSAGADVEELAG